MKIYKSLIYIEAPMYKAPEIFSNTESPTNIRAKPPDTTNGITIIFYYQCMVYVQHYHCLKPSNNC